MKKLFAIIILAALALTACEKPDDDTPYGRRRNGMETERGAI